MLIGSPAFPIIYATNPRWTQTVVHQDYDGAIQHYTTSLELILEALTKGGTSTEAEEHGCIIKLRDVVLSNRAEVRVPDSSFLVTHSHYPARQDFTRLLVIR